MKFKHAEPWLVAGILLVLLGCTQPGEFYLRQICKPAGLEDWMIEEQGLKVYYTEKGTVAIYDHGGRVVRFVDARTGDNVTMATDSYVCQSITEIPPVE